MLEPLYPSIEGLPKFAQQALMRIGTLDATIVAQMFAA